MQLFRVFFVSAKFSGSVGVLHLVKVVEDLNFILNHPPAPPYAAVLYPYLFNRKNLMKLKNSTYVSAIVVINNTTKMESFSHESNCPNQFSGLVNEKQTCDIARPDVSWNPSGTGLLLEDFPFPIYYVQDATEIAKIINCYVKFNSYDFEKQHERSLCSIQIKAFMSAAVNSEVCTRRTDTMSGFKYCDPLEGKNLYATLFPREIVDANMRKVDENESFIMVTTRMDTTSMFDGIGQGAMDSLVSYVTLMSTAQLLRRLLPEVKENYTNVIFMFFNGESYDYIGSQRFVYDIEHGAFPSIRSKANPIKLENIKFLIDIGVLDNPSKLLIYHYTEFAAATQIVNLLKSYNTKFDLNAMTSNKFDQNLPPSSAQSFLRKNTSFPAVILTSWPFNKYYHSIYDNYENIGFEYKNTSKDFTALIKLDNFENFANDSIQMKIRNVSSILAFSLYEMITNTSYMEQFGANIILIDEMLYCFLLNSDCRLFAAATPPGGIAGSGIPPLRYISVQGHFDLESTTSTIKTLIFLLGRKQPDIEKSNCTRSLFWMAGVDGKGECYLTTSFSSPALSPAFILENYDWKSGEYSTWAESTWRELSATIFLQPSRFHESLTFSIGFVVMVISIVIVFIINSKSDVLFGNSMSTVAM